jgi:hypothetical protein
MRLLHSTVEINNKKLDTLYNFKYTLFVWFYQGVALKSNNTLGWSKERGARTLLKF